MLLDILKEAFFGYKTEKADYFTRGENMDELAMLRGTEPRKILQKMVEAKACAIMSYLSKGKWHVAKVVPVKLGINHMLVEILPGRKQNPLNIQIDQPVGMSMKYKYGKFIFEAKVLTLEAPTEDHKGGCISLLLPDRIEIVQRRSYFRVHVPHPLKVNVMLWHRRKESRNQVPARHYWQGKLVDISAGGIQVAIDKLQNTDFRQGQFISLRFTPMPYETPLMFNAKIRNMLPTVDGRNICMGLQIVGLEASYEGREILKRLCNIVEQYHQMNQCDRKKLLSS